MLASRSNLISNIRFAKVMIQYAAVFGQLASHARYLFCMKDKI